MISVITITRDNFDELRRTLESLDGAPGVESIVVNGGTCEESKALLNSRGGKIIQEPDQGISDAFNKGARLASGSAVAFLNSGDRLILKEYYAQAERLLEQDPKIAFVYSDLIFEDPIAGKVRMRPSENFESLGRGMPVPHPTLIIRSEVFKEVGEFSLNYRIAMDFDFVVRMLVQGHRGKYLPVASVQMDGEGISSSREYEGLRECRRALIEAGLFGLSNRLGYLDRLSRLRIREALRSNRVGQKLLACIKSLKNPLR